MCETMKDKQSDTVRDAFARSWIKHYGAPELLVTDQGPEFLGGEFTRYLSEQACVRPSTLNLLGNRVGLRGLG